MSTKAEWAELFESVHGRKPSPQEFLDAKAADFDTSTLIAQAASVEAPANEPVAEEVPAEQASSESPFGDAAFSEAPVQQPTPQFDSSMFEKAPISSAQGFGTVPNPAAAGSADKPLFNLILPIVAIALSVIFAILAWFISPAWFFIILTVLAVAVAVVSLVFSLKSSKKLLSIIATGVAGLMLFVSIGGFIFQMSQNSSDSTSSSKASKVADKDDDSDSKSDSKGDSTDVNDYIDKNAKFDWNESKFKKLKAGKDSVKSIIKTYGKASNAEMSGDELKLTYSGKDYVESVYLNFKKQYDGTFILSYASGSFPQDKVEVDNSYKSDWTKEQYEALAEGDYSDPSNGTKLKDVIKDHPKASNADYTISTSREGEFKKEMTLSYSDFDAEEGKLKSVYLSFDTKEGEDTFYLAYKSGLGDD